MELYVIPGHGAGDSGAVGGGYQEQDLVRRVATRLKELNPNHVHLHPFSDNAYESNSISKLMIPKDWQIIELHMDSASQSARGGHVIINSTFEPDRYDKALASFFSSFLPGRSTLISKRRDLANPKRAASKGYPYRLVEMGFITNTDDRSKVINQKTDLAIGILKAFGMSANGTTTVDTYEPQPDNDGIAIDGYWGKDTTTALQKALGTVEDGIISEQYALDFDSVNDGGLATGWQILSYIGAGSKCIKALQNKVGAKSDGFFGRKTCLALQAYLGTDQDGTVSAPSLMVKEMQRRLNAGTF